MGVGPSHGQGFNIIILFLCVAPLGKLWVCACARVCPKVWRKKEEWKVSDRVLPDNVSAADSWI